MPEASKCPQCGAPLPANAPGNRCPRCLLQFAVTESSQGDVSEQESDSANERPGIVIGPYKLLQQIGEGGFGVVFMADQVEPVQRKVALKVIKAGMDTRE